jgi:uncharacterized protein DUF3892
MVNVTAVHMTGGTGHEHIASVRWTNPDTETSGESTRQAMVEWIRDENGVARVHGSDGSVSSVGVVDANPPYIRTYADGNWNDNLLALPRY